MRAAVMQPHSDEESFGNLLLIATGDFRQVAPVIKHGSQREAIHASIRSHPFWNRISILRLHQPMRSQEDPSFTAWLDAVGDGIVDYVDPDRKIISLNQFTASSNFENILNSLFPADILIDPLKCIQRAILSPINIQVDQYNNWIPDRIGGEKKRLFAVNWIKEVDSQSHAIQNTAVDDYLAAIKEPGVPPHELELKVGCICALMRNLSLEKKLVKNARVVVQEIHRRSVVVQTLANGDGNPAVQHAFASHQF